MGDGAVVVVGGAEIETHALIEFFLADGLVGFADAAPRVWVNAHEGPAIVPFVALGSSFV